MKPTHILFYLNIVCEAGICRVAHASLSYAIVWFFLDTVHLFIYIPEREIVCFIIYSGRN